MMKHSPGTARDLHHRLADWWGSAHAEQLISAWADLPGDKWNTALQRSALLAADTYLVTDEMSALCRQAGFALPYLRVTRTMLPAERGFIVFNDNAFDHEDLPATMKSPPARVYAWRTDARAGAPGVWVNSYVDSQEQLNWIQKYRPDVYAELDADASELADLLDRATRPYRAPLQPNGLTFVPFDQTIEWTAHIHENDTFASIQMVVAAWLLMDQPITLTEKPPLQRAFTKRAERAGLTSEITVIMLRRPRSQSEGDGTSGRQYHSRWIVQGHWRRIPNPDQPQRITWVHGYVKGPIDAPLVIRDRVTVLGR